MRSRSAHSDEALRSRWQSSVTPPVVFIIGLHRSGTTFLYESMSRILPVAKLSISDVVHFDHLIRSHLADGGRADRDAVDGYFKDRRARTRANDSLPLSSDTAEEYGWILRRSAGSYRTTDRTVGTLRDLICKLAFIHPNARAVLLKNPWDTPNAPYLATRFPEAKFVFIRRKPIELLNSELANSLYFTDAPDALLSLLTKGISGTRAFLFIARTLRLLLGTSLFTRISLRLLTADVAERVRSYEKALEAMPKERVLEVSYDRLVEEPQQVLRSIAAFLDLPVADSISGIVALRRGGGLARAVREREQRLRERLGAAPAERRSGW